MKKSFPCKHGGRYVKEALIRKKSEGDFTAFLLSFWEAISNRASKNKPREELSVSEDSRRCKWPNFLSFSPASFLVTASFPKLGASDISFPFYVLLPSIRTISYLRGRNSIDRPLSFDEKSLAIPAGRPRRELLTGPPEILVDSIRLHIPLRYSESLRV